MAPHIANEDFVLTIDDEDDVPDESGSEAESNTAKRKRDDEDDGLDPDFVFELEGQAGLEEFDGWDFSHQDSSKESVGRKGVDIAEIVARRIAKRVKLAEEAESEDENEGVKNLDGLDEDGEDEDELLVEHGFGMGAAWAEEENGGEEDSDEDEEHDFEHNADGVEVEEDDEEHTAAPVPHPNDVASESGESEVEDPEEVRRRNDFFAPEVNVNGEKELLPKTSSSFLSLSLSRPVLKGITSAGYTSPTPIQEKTIPVALMGKDVVGGAVTGSGKTAAFLIPILDRLIYRQKKLAVTRVAILMPTRELALQCFSVARKLASFTDITLGQAIGGLNPREQEKDLKKHPDIVIATPGRFIDFMRNSSSFAVDTIEILVLDEADRMLEEGFADELNEILTTIPKSRQTMLFSATMTSKVDDLIRVGLQRPVRIMVDALKTSAAGLVQEFVRLRPGREAKRLGYLMHICTRIHTERVIIFFRQKKEAHRVNIVFALCGLKAAELHGSMTQDQRIRGIESFRSGTASFLLATDLASRGLDIKGIDTVINYEAPQSHEIYLHRVGRTARAGRSGRACTLAAEPDRKVVKAAVRAAKKQGAGIQQRSIPPEDADAWQTRIDGMEDEIDAVMREEREERALQATERDLTRADNIVRHEDEIKARPKKTWFQSADEKEQSKVKGRVGLNGPDAAADGAKRIRGKSGKLSNKQKKKLTIKDERKAGSEWKKSKHGKEALDTKKRKPPSGGFAPNGKRRSR